MSVSSPAQHTNGVWAVVWKLLKLRLIILYQSFRRANLRTKLGWSILGLILLAGLGAAFYLSLNLMRFLHSPELVEILGDTRPLFESMPTLILGAMFIGILFTSFGVLLQALYLAGDMDFLLSTPIPIRSVFIAKLLEAILPNFGLICIFALPLLYGIGVLSGYHFIFYPAVLILLFALALAAAGVASLLVMVVVRIFPARRVAEILGFVGATVSILCSQSGQLANMSQFNPHQTQQMLQLFYRFNQPWSPFTWAGKGLVRLGEGQWLAGLGGAALVLAGSLVVFLAALAASERLYYSGWANLRSVKKTKKARRAAPAVGADVGGNALVRRLSATPLVALIHKDFLMLRRDMHNMSQLVTPIIVGVVYAVMLVRGGNDFSEPQGNAPLWLDEAFRTLGVYSNIALTLFVGWMLLARLAGTSFAREGRSYWMLKTAPVSARQLIVTKFIVAYLPTLALCWVFLLVVWVLRRPGLQNLLFALPVVALSIAGNVGVNLTFGILGANMAWENPSQAQKGAMGCLGRLMTVVYLVVSLGLFFGPTVASAALGLPTAAGQVAGLALGGAVSLACAATPLLARGRVEQLGET